MNDETRTLIGAHARLGGPAMPDPTENVKALSEASDKRQDDLRDHEEQLVNEKIRHINDMRIADIRRIDDLRNAESRRVDEQATIRASFQDKLAIAEASRINAIRAVDVSAVTVASERATQQASVLANQVTTSADALRALVATTATAMAAQSQNMTQQFTDRLSTLEKAQYESKGKSTIVDPQMAHFADVIEKLVLKVEAKEGVGTGLNMAWVIGLGAIGAIGILSSIVLGLIAIFKP